MTLERLNRITIEEGQCGGAHVSAAIISASRMFRSFWVPALRFKKSSRITRSRT